MQKRARKAEYPAKVRKKIHSRDHESCFFCSREYHMEYACGGLQVMHIVPRSQGGLGVEQNGVLGCAGHHDLMDNGNKGLRPEMIGMLEDYMKRKYPGWNRESVTYRKYDF